MIRLPNTNDFKFVDNCKTKFDTDTKELIVLYEGDVLRFGSYGYENVYTPRKGKRYPALPYGVGDRGNYWIKTDDLVRYRYNFGLYKDTCQVFMTNPLGFKYTVKLVSDEPIEGWTKFNNVWWQPDICKVDDNIYFTYEEALQLAHKNSQLLLS